MIISFAQTTPAIRNKSKTVTRRFWKDEYARKFRKGSTHQAWDASPRTRRGHRVGEIVITHEPYKEALCMMTEEHFEREGGKRFWRDREEFIECMGGPTAIPWVIEFKTVWAESGNRSW